MADWSQHVITFQKYVKDTLWLNLMKNSCAFHKILVENKNVKGKISRAAKERREIPSLEIKR